MALQVAWTNPTTLVSSSTAYAHVVSIYVDCVVQTIDLGVGLYFTQAAYNAGAVPFAPVFHAWPTYSDFLGVPVDFQAAAYEFLKQLPEFAGAIDA